MVEARRGMSQSGCVGPLAETAETVQHRRVCYEPMQRSLRLALTPAGTRTGSIPKRMSQPLRLNAVEAARASGISESTLPRPFGRKRVQEVGHDRNNRRVFTEADLDRIGKALEPVR